MKNKISLIVLLIFTCQLTPTDAPSGIVLNPAGDAHCVGRVIGKDFERTIAAHFTQNMAAVIETELGIPALLTHAGYETRTGLECAHFANCVQARLYININFFQTTAQTAEWYIYYYSRGTDFVQKSAGLNFLPADQADILHKAETHAWAQKIASVLKHAPCEIAYVVQGPYGIPITPLLGVIAPAISIEIGLTPQTDWHSLIPPLMAALRQLPILESRAA